MTEQIKTSDDRWQYIKAQRDFLSPTRRKALSKLSMVWAEQITSRDHRFDTLRDLAELGLIEMRLKRDSHHRAYLIEARKVAP